MTETKPNVALDYFDLHYLFTLLDRDSMTNGRSKYSNKIMKRLESAAMEMEGDADRPWKSGSQKWRRFVCRKCGLLFDGFPLVCTCGGEAQKPSAKSDGIDADQK